MERLGLSAEPWWVNLLIVIPLAAYGTWRRRGLVLAMPTLLAAAVFGTAFGFVEAAVVVYLRAATGLLTARKPMLFGFGNHTPDLDQQIQLLAKIPVNLHTLEVFRESATMVMLIAVACMAVGTRRERCAIFLWTFAVWDIFYYVGLWATIRWPPSLRASDVLFLIPVPWVSPVWFPILVSALTIVVVILARKARRRLPEA